MLLQSCPTLSDSRDCNPPGSSVGFSRQEYWSGLPLCLHKRSRDEVKHETLCKYKPGKTEPMQSAFIGFVLFAYNIQYLFFKILDFIVFMRQCFDMTITSKDLLSDS